MQNIGNSRITRNLYNIYTPTVIYINTGITDDIHAVQLYTVNERHKDHHRVVDHLPPQQWTPHHRAESSTGHHSHRDITTIIVASVVIVWIISVDHGCLSLWRLDNYTMFTHTHTHNRKSSVTDTLTAA